jgi:hypothetical protein
MTRAATEALGLGGIGGWVADPLCGSPMQWHARTQQIADAASLKWLAGIGTCVQHIVVREDFGSQLHRASLLSRYDVLIRS